MSQTSPLMVDASARPVTAEENPQVPTAVARCVPCLRSCTSHGMASVAEAQCLLPQFPSVLLSHSEDDCQGMRDALASEEPDH